jgi:hypothetical protein
MPDNPEKWSEVLTTYLREQFPDAAKLPVVVEYRKRDDQSGTALGALQISSEEASKTLFIPFIIRKFELSPLDVWMEPKTQIVHPLTKDTFKEVFFVQGPADGLDARPTDSTGSYFNDPSLWTTNYPPLQGRYSYASAGFPLLDVTSDSYTKEDGESFKQYLRDNPSLVAKFQKHGYAEVLEKLAKKSYVNSGDYVASAMNLIPTSAVQLKRNATANDYSVLTSVEGIFDTGEVVRMNTDDCRKFLSKITGSTEDVLSELDQEGEKLLIVRKPADGVFLYDSSEPGPEEAKEFAMYRVKTQTGLQLDGIVVPNVVDFAGRKKGYKLFLSKSASSFQKSIAGIKMVGVDSKAPIKHCLEPRDIRVGQTGTFMYIDDGKAIATEPVTIKAIENHDCLHVVDVNGKRFNVRRGYGDYFTKEEKEAHKPIDAKSSVPGLVKEPKRVYLDAHGMIEVRKDIFIIPSKMMWIPMEDLRDVSATPAEWIMKEAASKMELDPMTVRWTGIDFDITGAGLPKLSLDKARTELLLANSGVSMNKIAAAMKKAKATGRVKIHGVDRLRSRAEKVSETGKLIAKISSVVASLKTNMLKEAAEIDDNATVDVLLGLNFLNPDNLAKFVAYKPVFDKVLDYLAELTLASRLGLKDIPEAAAVSGMHKLMEIVDGLGKMQASMKRPATKTAAAQKPLSKGKKYLPAKGAKLIAMVGG